LLEPEPYLVLTDPDPRGPKTSGFDPQHWYYLIRFLRKRKIAVTLFFLANCHLEAFLLKEKKSVYIYLIAQLEENLTSLRALKVINFP
jgi:hypothetical protein